MRFHSLHSTMFSSCQSTLTKCICQAIAWNWIPTCVKPTNHHDIMSHVEPSWDEWTPFSYPASARSATAEINLLKLWRHWHSVQFKIVKLSPTFPGNQWFSCLLYYCSSKKPKQGSNMEHVIFIVDLKKRHFQKEDNWSQLNLPGWYCWLFL